MSGQVTRRSTAIHRLAIGLLVLAAMVLMAPAASATPESDAADAISAAFDASGGDGGPLGPRNGDVYPIGAGFGQNFAGGKIFFTPATGAHVMSGAILDKYESLGGPGDGDLGFPTIDEGAGKAPDSRNTTFSASDNPVIFWTPENGAHVVRGPINAAWDKLGGSAGSLGVPTDDETYGGALITQKFTGGEVSYNTRDKTFSTVPPDLAGQLADLSIPDDPAAAIGAARRAAGGPLGPLGAAQGPPYQIGKDGLGQNFAGGKIFYSPATGANVVSGQVLAKYESVGGPEGDLGFPISSEADGGLATASRVSRFAAEDKPVVFWTPEYGAVIVRGAMNAAWDRLGGAKGALGAPMADQSEDGNVISQRFSGGVVSWDRTKHTFKTEPGNLAADLVGLQVPGQNAGAPEATQASPSGDRKWFSWSWWWLLAVIPVLVLIGLVAFAAIRRRSAAQEDPFDYDSGDLGAETPACNGTETPAYNGAGASPGQVRSSAEDYSAAMFGESHAGGGVSAVPPVRRSVAHDPDPETVWGAPVSRVDDDLEKELDADESDDEGDDEGALLADDDEDPDAVDTTPTPIQKVIERDPMTDSGRHSRIEDDHEPNPPRTAFRLALGDPNRPPDGYPVKASTTSGLFWAPGTPHFDEARAEIWFATAELAQANGFVADAED